MEKSAEALIRAGKYDEALAVAARILKFDQKNTRARKWRADLRDLSRRQKEEARIKVLIEEADQKTTLLDFSAAEARLKEALQIDPSNSTARTRLDQLLSLIHISNSSPDTIPSPPIAPARSSIG